MTQSNILLESGTNELEIIEFFIAEEDGQGNKYTGFYGMNVAKVLEIIRKPDVTGMPNKHHPAALGTFNLRGRVLPLVDLSIWLGKNMASSDAHKVIVSEFSGVITAFLVSGVTRIHRLSWSQVEAPSGHVRAFSNDSVTGVVRFDDRIVFILDMEKVVASLNPRLQMDTRIGEVAEAATGEGYKALVADDSGSIRNMIVRTMEKAGFTCTQALNGREAWDIVLEWKRLAAEQNRPLTDFVDLIVSDIEMPEMDGHNFTKRVKEDPVLKNLPVILFSSLITETLRHKGIAVGADDQVSKPDLPTLTERAKGLIKQYHGK
ncbi:chemotaxis protein [Desulfovibrio mangrovi]|uniref:chemotaxis protein n=1 Tax=Desulfovibrio mangrovi TaxID=2976983 RepID=UPI0022452A06|nr:chemotaxis protein [Desulfovibrio mangrovi]UZP68682.1 chemotaxis protein [Desulfovibrio mangrovi]